MKLSYKVLAGGVDGAAFYEAAAPDPDPRSERAWTRAAEARIPLIRARNIVRHGGECIVFTKAELHELRKAAGNSTSDPEWYRDFAKTAGGRKALLSVAAKVGFMVMTPNRGKGYR